MNNIEMDRMIARLLSCTKDFGTYMGAGEMHSVERILDYSRRIFKAAGMLGREASKMNKQMKADEFFEPPVRAHNFSGADPLPSCTDRQPPKDVAEITRAGYPSQEQIAEAQRLIDAMPEGES